MRITVVQGYHLPVPPILGGAVEKVWHALGQEFVRRGHQVNHLSCRHRDLADEETAAGVHHLRVPGADRPAAGWRHNLRDLRYSLRARRQLPDGDVLVSNTFWLPLLGIPARCGRLYVHAARSPRGQYRWYLKAARVQGPSQVLIDDIAAEEPRLQDRLRAIPNPLPWDPPATVAPPSARPAVILYAGRIHPEKGIELLCRGFARFHAAHPAWRLRIVGPSAADGGGGGSRYREQLESSHRGLPIEWLAPVYDPLALQALYGEARLFAYPSLAEKGETFGLAPLEAMSCGSVPVVSTLPCFRDFITDRDNAFVFDHRRPDPEIALAEALAAAAGDDALLGRMAAAARVTAARFTVATVAGLFLDDFASLLTACAPAERVKAPLP